MLSLRNLGHAMPLSLYFPICKWGRGENCGTGCCGRGYRT